MDRMIDPATGDYNGKRTTGLENAVQMRLRTPLGSYLFDKTLGSRLSSLPRKDTAQTRALAEQYAFQAISVTASRKLPGWISLSVRITQATGDVATFEHPVRVS